MMNTANQNSSLVIGAMIMATALSPYANTFDTLQTPIVEKVIRNEFNTTPKLIILDQRNWLKQANQLFDDSREFTAEEAVRYEHTLARLFRPTGEN
jgi:uncharacterized protein YigA (DUF484 family)